MAIDPDPTHYRSLGLPRGASPEQVRIAYLNLAKLLHPDRYNDRPQAERNLAERRMREVNEAYRTLSDPSLRRSYDEALRVADEPPSSGSRRTSADTAGGSTANAGARRATAPGDPSRAERYDADPTWRRDDGTIRYGSDFDADDVELSPTVAFLLRRGPIIAVLVLAAVLFIGTAYAGQGRSNSPTLTVTPTTRTPCSIVIENFSTTSVVPSPPGTC